MKNTLTAFLFAAVLPAQAQDYAAWAKANKDGSWTEVTEKAVLDSQLPDSLPTDIERFCPAYKTRVPADRVKFWVGLLSIVARPESNFKPDATYTESFPDSKGNMVISRGLLQLSIESANGSKYSCGIKAEEDLHKPTINLTCGVKILNAWVKNDNDIATYLGDKPRGGGRYWSTLREKPNKARNHLPELVKFTQSMKVCRTE